MAASLKSKCCIANYLVKDKDRVTHCAWGPEEAKLTLMSVEMLSRVALALGFPAAAAQAGARRVPQRFMTRVAGPLFAGDISAAHRALELLRGQKQQLGTELLSQMMQDGLELLPGLPHGCAHQGTRGKPEVS